jgi:transcriptional regulator with XRE-family HTH domain
MARRAVAASRASADALRLLGDQIKLARKAKGWSVADVAARLDVGMSTVTKIESGAPTVSVGTVFNAAFLLGVNVFRLEGDDGRAS